MVATIAPTVLLDVVNSPTVSTLLVFALRAPAAAGVVIGPLAIGRPWPNPNFLTLKTPYWPRRNAPRVS
jgi:hypothetical protein